MAIVSSYNCDDNEEQSSSKTPKSINSAKPSKTLKSCLDPSLGEADKKTGNIFRPTGFDGYIGQTRLKETLKISISAAQKRSDLASMGHILLYGPPGLGKTSCAYLLANELGSDIKIFSAPALERPKDIIGILMSLNEGDILFIDEIHRLNKITEELLYPALEDFEVDLSAGKDNSSRIMRLKINKFILVGATTKLGYISAPLRDRFLHVQRMEYYSVAELSQIAELNIQKIGLKVESSACTVIAQRSRGTPRIVNRLIRLVRDYAEFNDIGVVCPQVADQALNLYKIDQYGLDDMDRKILKVLQENYDGGPAGLESISTMVGEDKNTVEDYYEPFLLQSGFLIRTHRGRKLTGKGVNYLTKLA